MAAVAVAIGCRCARCSGRSTARPTAGCDGRGRTAAADHVPVHRLRDDILAQTAIALQ